MSLLQDINSRPLTKVKADLIQRDNAEQKKHGLLELVTSAKIQTDLKKSDASDAGASDVIDKARASGDIGFSLMRNTINANGGVSGSDVANYIEKAEALNDEVDTIPFGLETDDGQIVKVYVNAEQADAFENAMKNMLGMEDDIEEAINRLTTEFDIVDVVWPTAPDAEGEPDPDSDLSLDDTANLEFDPEDEQDFAADNYDVIADAAVKADDKKASKETDDIDAAAAKDDDEEDKDSKSKKKKKKKKQAEPAEPAEEGLNMNNVNLLPEGFAMDDITEGGTVIYKVVGRNYYAMSKVRQKKRAHTLQLQNGATIQNSEVVSTDASDWKNFENAKYTSKNEEQETNMTLGSSFLARVLQEATPGDKDGVKDGFNIPLDSQARALTAKLKLPFAKRLIAFHVMAGVPGRYLNTEDIEGSISEAADMLRKRVAVRRAFIAMYEGLATAKGYVIQAADESVDEDQYEIQTPAGQKVYGPGPKQKCQTRMDRFKKEEEPQDIKGYKIVKVTQVNEAESGKKRGSFIQKLFETVLIELGLPQSLVVTTGPAAVGTGIYRTAELIEQDATLQRSLRLLATRLGVKQIDATAALKAEAVQTDLRWRNLPALQEKEEQLDVGNDAYASAVAGLMADLGVPQDVFKGGAGTLLRAALVKQKRDEGALPRILGGIDRLRKIIATSPNRSDKTKAE